MIECPRCRLVSPSDALQCDCGFDFSAKRKRIPVLDGHEKTTMDKWRINTKYLTIWLSTYFMLWLAGILIVSSAYKWDQHNKGDMGTRLLMAGLGLMFLSIAPYVACIYYAYSINKNMNDLSVYKPSAVKIIIYGVILNPLCVGWAVPLGVLITSMVYRQRYDKALNALQGDGKA